MRNIANKKDNQNLNGKKKEKKLSIQKRVLKIFK